MMRIRLVAMSAILAFVAWVAAALLAGPSRFGFSDRIERHLFPEVTTGPSEPAWSPDGRWIAFSMRGDIWKVPAEGGDAIALTKGPWYYFEPAWSPDGAQVAFTVDTGGNLDLGVVGADGGAVTRLTDAASVEIEPAWTPDGRALLFVSSRNRGFDIYRLDLATRDVTPVVTGAGDQLQPAVSPDGLTLAYVSPVPGRLGTGGIWTRPLAGGGEPALVRYEESEYRMRPAWTPDGRALVFGSDERGSNDIAMVAADGGNTVTLTADPMGEFSVAVSPDGRRIAFISNRAGPMTLYVAPIGGGPASSWRRVPIASTRAAAPTGRLRGRLVDRNGQSMPGRVQLVGSDGRAYAPADGFARVMAVTETHYFHTSGEFEVDVPAGDVQVTVLRGLEYTPVSSTARVIAGQTADLAMPLTRHIDMPALGWYSGDTHAHDLHQGRFGLTHESLFLQSVAEDVHVTNVLIHMDGTRLMGRWDDLTGEPDPVSTSTHLLQFSEEFRGSLGHIGMLGLKTFILPLIGGANNTPYEQVASDAPYLDGARAQGGIAGFMHPYTTSSPDPAGWAGSLIPVDVALGKGDFYDVASLYSDELASAEMYYKLLNSGFRLPATGGTDNFPDVWRDPPPGTDRTYAKVEVPLTLQSWMSAVKAGRTFATTGPLLFLTVNGQEPGGVIRLPESSDDRVRVRVQFSSIVPIDRVDVVVNGEPRTLSPATMTDQVFDLALPDGGWIAARAVGPPSRLLGDSIAFAQTSPVYVVRAGRPPFVNASDARFLAAVVDAIWARASRGPWRSEPERAAFKAEIDRARAIYLARAGG